MDATQTTKWTRFTPERREAFVRLIAEGVTVSGAARAVGINRQHAYEVREKDAEFAAAWADAEETYTDWLRDEFRRRLREGVVTERDLAFRGQLTGDKASTRVMDTDLLLRELGRRDPSYGERRQVEHTGAVAHTYEHILAKMMSPERLAEVDRIFHREVGPANGFILPPVEGSVTERSFAGA